MLILTLFMISAVSADDVNATVTRDNHFDLFIFTQHWPVSTCMDWEHMNANHVCRPIADPVHWTVHGLWPTQIGKIAPGFCNTSWPLNVDELKPIKAELDAYWPDIEMRDSPTNLWAHEWFKHGTCAAQLPSFDSELKYFKAGIMLAQQNPLVLWLQENNNIPGASYTKQNFWDAVVKHTGGKKPHIDCLHIDGVQYIKEIKLCFNKTLDMIDCDVIVGGEHHKDGPLGSCNPHEQILYPDLEPPYNGWRLFGIIVIICIVFFCLGIFAAYLREWCFVRSLGYQSV